MTALSIAATLNSTIRMTMPVLFVALGSLLCSRVKVFNIALEAQMLMGSFAGVLVSYFSQSVFLAVLAAMFAGMFVAFIVAFLQVKLKASDMVVGTSLNLLVSGLTTFLLFVIFKTRGAFISPDIVVLPKFKFSFLADLPIAGEFLSELFSSLTVLDFLAVIMAFAMYIFMYKTVFGFRMLSVGINKQAAISQGINSERIQMGAVVFSGLLSGLGGVLLSLGRVQMFSQNMTSGRGFLAMAASNLGATHPIGVLLSSLFFGFFDAIQFVLQGTAIRSQITQAVPYIVTILAMVLSGVFVKAKNKRAAGKI